jgi:hypothetical protein
MVATGIGTVEFFSRVQVVATLPDDSPDYRTRRSTWRSTAGFITLPTNDWLRLIEAVQEVGLKAKPEVGIQHGAGGGATTAEELEQIGQLECLRSGIWGPHDLLGRVHTFKGEGRSA